MSIITKQIPVADTGDDRYHAMSRRILELEKLAVSRGDLIDRISFLADDLEMLPNDDPRQIVGEWLNKVLRGQSIPDIR